MNNCYCTAPASLGYLCEAHATNLRRQIRSSLDLLRELDTTVTKTDQQGIKGGGGGGAGISRPLIFNVKASETRHEIATTLSQIAARTRSHQKPQRNLTQAQRDMLQALYGFEDLVRHPDVTWLSQRLHEAHKDAWRVMDRVMEKITYGKCACDATLKGTADDDTLTCRGCGKHYGIAELKAFRYIAAMDALEEKTGTLKEIHHLLRVTGHSTTLRSLKSWTTRKKNPLTPVEQDTNGNDIYKYTDARDIATKQG